MTRYRRLVIALPFILPVSAGHTQDAAPRIVANPSPLSARSPAAPGETALDLNVTYTLGKLWNPARAGYDDVWLRSYQGTRVDPDAPFVSPTIEVVPGDTIRLTLHNKLPADPGCVSEQKDVNTPHCFNGTNLHTHGLWVNPGGNGDNVLISINPGVSFQYEYKIPPDHPAGTFWYHTHRHGSTALQVSSGMAGALIVRGRREPTAAVNGDIDTLLRTPAAQPFRERVLVFQQIPYACRDANNAIKTNPDGTYRCDAGDRGTIEGYDQLGSSSWGASGRFTSINGHVLPTFDGAKAGAIERWRMIHGGVRDTISLQLRKMKQGSADIGSMTVRSSDGYAGVNCTGDPLPLHLMAADGLTMAAVLRTDLAVFQPAYRWDALVVFPEPGRYCVIDAAAPAPGSVGHVESSRQLLGVVEVAAGTSVGGDMTAYLRDRLVEAAGRNMPLAARTAVVADLRDGMKLSRFLPHPDITDGEVTGHQELTFKIDVNASPVQFLVDGKPYDPGRIDRILRLGGVDEWLLKSDFASHPFHIHINPFQVVRILDPNGKDVSGVQAVDDAGGQPDPQYRGLKGVWKDTLWVKSLVPGHAPGQYRIVVRTRYQRYIGDFVLHCHILDHEDQGMMQNVRIALPDGVGGTATHH